MKTLAIALATLGLAAGLTGCERSLDMKKVTKAIEDKMNEDVAKVDKVECPEKVKVKKDDVFNCDVEFECGTSIEVEVKQKNNEGDLHVEPTKTVYGPKALQKKLSKEMKKKGVKVKVDCGDEVRVVEEGDTFECDAKGPKGKGKIAIEITSDDGDFRWKPVR